MANVIIKKDFTGDTSDVIKVSSDSGGVVKSTTSGDPAGTISVTSALVGTNINDKVGLFLEGDKLNYYGREEYSCKIGLNYKF